MRPENAEFAALFKASGWTQVQAAKRFYCSQAVISRWLNDVDPADKKAVELFKLILASENPSALGPVEMHDRSTAPKSNDSEIWRRRAKLAEKDLAELRAGLRALLSKSSSKLDAMVEDHIAAEVDELSAGHKPKP